MTVQEVILALGEFPHDANVYVPSNGGRLDIVKAASPMIHVNLPEGIIIPDDVVLMPWTDDELEGVNNLSDLGVS